MHNVLMCISKTALSVQVKLVTHELKRLGLTVRSMVRTLTALTNVCQ